MIFLGFYKLWFGVWKGGIFGCYCWLGCYCFLKGKSFGKRFGRVVGRKKVFSCFFFVRWLGFKVFVLYNCGVCYVMSLLRIYIFKLVIRGCFIVEVGGISYIDVYIIG